MINQIERLSPRDMANATIVWGDIPMKNGQFMEGRPVMVSNGKIYEPLRDNQAKYLGNTLEDMKAAYVKGYATGAGCMAVWARSEAEARLKAEHEALRLKMEEELNGKIHKYTQTVNANTVASANPLDLVPFDEYVEETTVDTRVEDLVLPEEELALLELITKRKA